MSSPTTAAEIPMSISISLVDVAHDGTTRLYSHDEAALLAGYRLIKQQRSGDFLVRIADGQVREWSCRPNLGSAGTLNALMQVFYGDPPS